MHFYIEYVLIHTLKCKFLKNIIYKSRLNILGTGDLTSIVCSSPLLISKNSPILFNFFLKPFVCHMILGAHVNQVLMLYGQ